MRNLLGPLVYNTAVVENQSFGLPASGAARTMKSQAGRPASRYCEQMTLSRPAWRAIAVIVAITFFWMATRVDVYQATSPQSLSRLVFGPEVPQFAHPWWLALHVWLRKTYSVIAFAIVGFSAHRALGPTTRPALRAAMLVALYSLGIEVAQHLLIGPEPVTESVLDVVCGAVGGWLAIVADHRLLARGGQPSIVESIPQRN